MRTMGHGPRNGNNVSATDRNASVWSSNPYFPELMCNEEEDKEEGLPLPFYHAANKSQQVAPSDAQANKPSTTLGSRLVSKNGPKACVLCSHMLLTHVFTVLHWNYSGSDIKATPALCHPA